MPLELGLMDRVITLQTATKSQDEDGAEILTWDTSEEIRAQWLPAGTREAYRAQQRLQTYIDGVYRIHFRAEPTSDGFRIIGHDGRPYDLKPAMELGRGEGWEIPVVAHG